MKRSTLAANLVSRILALDRSHPLRVGIDGVSTAELRRLYAARYVPGQRIDLEAEAPMDRASIVVDNADVEKPRIVAARGPDRS